MTGAGRRQGAEKRTLGLRVGIKACLFDLDGVLTQTARVHPAGVEAAQSAALDALHQGDCRV
jgi:hypothetical protein